MFIALILVVLLGAVGAVALLAGQSEALLSANFRQGQEAVYVADGALNRALTDLTGLPDWTQVLSGTATGSFADGSATGSKPLPAGGTAVLCCGGSTLTGELQLRAYGGSGWGADTPQWQMFSWGPAALWHNAAQIQSVFYSVVWAADDPADPIPPSWAVPAALGGRAGERAAGFSGPTHRRRSGWRTRSRRWPDGPRATHRLGRRADRGRRRAADRAAQGLPGPLVVPAG